MQLIWLIYYNEIKCSDSIHKWNTNYDDKINSFNCIHYILL